MTEVTHTRMSVLLIVGPKYTLTVDHVACCPLVNHGEHADGSDRLTDGWTPDRYITLSIRRSQRTVIRTRRPTSTLGERE